MNGTSNSNMKKGKESPTMYEIGDPVWFSVSNLEVKHPARRHTWLPKYIGPLKVIDIAGYNAVRLDMPKYLATHPIVSTSQVKMYIQHKQLDKTKNIS